MSVDELKAEIEKLDPTAFCELRGWVNALDDDEWDKQIRADAEAGKLDFLFAEADAAHRAGTTLDAPGADDEASRKAS